MHRGPAEPGRRPGHRPRAQPAEPQGRADPAARRPAPGQPATGQAAGRRGPGPVQLVLPEPGRLAVAARGTRNKGQGQNQVRQAVRRPEAAAVDRAGPGRQPADRHPRRAHHRPGPGRPARHLGAHRERQGPRGHHRPGHPLHGRGRTPLRSRGPDRLGPGRGHRHPGQPGRRGRDRAAHPVPPVGTAPRPTAREPARCHRRHLQGRCRGGHRQQQRAQRGHLRAGPQPDPGPPAARGPGQPGGRVPRPHRPARTADAAREARSVEMSAITVAPPQTPASPRTNSNSSSNSNSHGLLKLTLTELKLLTRERVRAALPIAIPLILIVILGNIRSLRQPQAIYGGESFIDLYTTTMVVFGLALLALTNMPMMLADYRERGVLKRLQTTPIGPARVLAAQLMADLAVAVVMVVAILAVARIGFAVPLPRQVGGFVLAAALAAAALLSAGLLIAAIAPTGRVARGIGGLLFYAMMFFAGLWLPIPSMPAVLQHISHATPLGAAVPALTAAAEGSMPTALQLGTMAGWAVALGLAAARFFRWE